MSTRRTIAYGRLFHVYEEVTDGRIVLEIPLRPWKRLAKDAWFVTVKIPADGRRFESAGDKRRRLPQRRRGA